MALKVVIVGAGRAGSELHLDAYRSLPGVEVCALCDVDGAKAAALAAEKGLAAGYGSLGEALAAQRPDIVSICTPPPTHFALAKEALEGGADVLVEKPIFETVEQARDIQAVCARTGRKCSAVHNKKYLPGYRAAQRLFRAGAIGEALHVHAVWMLDGAQNRMVYDPDFWCHKLPGGRWQEMIAHPLYNAYQFVGPMRLKNVEAKQVRGRWPWLPGDEVEITLESDAGYVSIKLSANIESKYNFMVVYGTRKILYIDRLRAAEMMGALSGHPQFIEAGGPYEQDGHDGVIRDFVAWVQGRTPEPPTPWAEAMNTFELVLAVGQALKDVKGARA